MKRLGKTSFESWREKKVKPKLCPVFCLPVIARLGNFANLQYQVRICLLSFFKRTSELPKWPPRYHGSGSAEVCPSGCWKCFGSRHFACKPGCGRELRAARPKTGNSSFNNNFNSYVPASIGPVQNFTLDVRNVLNFQAHTWGVGNVCVLFLKLLPNGGGSLFGACDVDSASE